MKWVASLLGVLVFVSSAQANTAARCSDWRPFGPNCHVTVTATSAPQTRVIFGRGWGGAIASRWVLTDRDFTVGYSPRGCRDYGRLRDLRVIETWCGGGYRIKFRSVGAPVGVRFEFGTL